jgi:U3 small nucleolar RNA-associated protein 21
MATKLPGYETTVMTVKEGSGAKIAKGDRATVHATGVVKETGKKFWSTKDPGQEPFSYQAGVGQVLYIRAAAAPCESAPRLAGACARVLTSRPSRARAPARCAPQVITGWDQGCLGMAVGEERELVIPAKEGYGQQGFPAWGIPPGGTLVFTLECLSVAK